MQDTTAPDELERLIRELKLKPHPEGGWYAETWRAPAQPGQRSPGTAIYYALARGQRSHWHRVDATEIWHFYGGDPLLLSVSDGRTVTAHRLGDGVSQRGTVPQVIVQPGIWQSAEPEGAFTLLGCTVVPGFEFSGFELAPPGWTPKA